MYCNNNCCCWCTSEGWASLVGYCAIGWALPSRRQWCRQTFLCLLHLSIADAALRRCNCDFARSDLTNNDMLWQGIKSWYPLSSLSPSNSYDCKETFILKHLQRWAGLRLATCAQEKVMQFGRFTVWMQVSLAVHIWQASIAVNSQMCAFVFLMTSGHWAWSFY